MNEELATLLHDIRALLERQKDYELISGPPNKNEAWKLLDRIDTVLPAERRDTRTTE